MVMVVLERAFTIGLIWRNPGVTERETEELVTPLADAVICVDPGRRPIAKPVVELMDATAELPVDQWKATPGMMFPLASFAVAAI